jgi:DNA-binding response OmpR family regulator
MKILTVEDDNMIREGISEYLSEFGYTIVAQLSRQKSKIFIMN